MKNFLSNDSFLGKIFGSAGDIIILNILFVLCSIPIFTIGTAYTSMEFAFLKKKKESDSSVIRSFFYSFKLNFKQSFLCWIITLIIAFILLADLRMFSASGRMPSTLLYYVMIMIAFITSCIVLYLFPVIGVFENTTKNLCLQALYFATKNLPYTLLMLAIFGIPVYATFLNSSNFLFYISLWLFFGFGVIGYINSHIFWKIFSPHLNTDIED